MSGTSPGKWLRGARRAMARLPSLRMGRVPDAPGLSVRDPWPGDGDRGARLIKGELEIGGVVQVLRQGGWAAVDGSPEVRAGTHGFAWLRDLRALGTDAARLRARALVAEWINDPPGDPIAHRPDVTGARITAWLGHYDFFAATADDVFRQRLMSRLVSDARSLSAAMPAEDLDARALTSALAPTTLSSFSCRLARQSCAVCALRSTPRRQNASGSTCVRARLYSAGHSSRKSRRSRAPPRRSCGHRCNWKKRRRWKRAGNSRQRPQLK